MLLGGLDTQAAYGRFITETLNADHGVQGITADELMIELPLTQAISLHIRSLAREEAATRQAIAVAGGDPPAQRVFMPEELQATDRDGTKIEAGKQAAMKAAMQKAKGISPK